MKDAERRSSRDTGRASSQPEKTAGDWTTVPSAGGHVIITDRLFTAFVHTFRHPPTMVWIASGGRRFVWPRPGRRGRRAVDRRGVRRAASLYIALVSRQLGGTQHRNHRRQAALATNAACAPVLDARVLLRATATYAGPGRRTSRRCSANPLPRLPGIAQSAASSLGLSHHLCCSDACSGCRAMRRPSRGGRREALRTRASAARLTTSTRTSCSSQYPQPRLRAAR